MDVQREENPVLDLSVLETLLETLHDQDSAAFIRGQFRNACEIVERKNAEANGLRDQANRFNSEAQALRADLQNKVHEAEAEQQAAKEAQRKLNSIASEAQSLATHVKSLTEKFDKSSQVGGDFQEKTAEAVATLQSNIVALKKDAVTVLETAKGDVTDKLEGLLESAQSTKATVESVKAKSEELVTAAEAIKADQLKFSGTITDMKQALQDSATQEKLESSFRTLLDEIKGSHETIESLPSAEMIASKFNAKAAQEFGYTLTELRDRCNDFEDKAQSLEAENRTLQERVTSLDRSARLANSDLEVCEGDLRHATESLEQREQQTEELQQKCRDLSEQLKAARDRYQLHSNDLNNAQSRLQTAEHELLATHQRLRDAEANSLELTDANLNLRASLDSQGALNGSLNEQLTLALRDSQEASIARDRARTDLTALHDRMSEANNLHDMLGDAWKDEKNLLGTQISDKVKLLDSQERELTNLRHQASQIGVLEAEIADLRSQRDSLQKDVAGANARTEATKVDLLRSQQSLQTQDSDARMEQERLKQEVSSLRSKFEESQCRVQALEKGSQDAESLIADLQAQLEDKPIEDVATTPRQPLGELSELYLRLAEELREIPTAPEGCEEFSLLQVAVDIAPFFLEYGGRDNLMEFLEKRSEEWHCFQQVIQDPERGLIRNTCGKHPDRCLWVRVINMGTPVLDFKYTAV